MVDLPPNIEIMTEDEAYLVAARLQALLTVSTYVDGQATALQKRIVTQLRKEGLDGQGRLSFITGTDAQRAARRVVQPLRVIQADCYNAAQAAILFRQRIQREVFDPIRAARRLANSPDAAGLVVK